MPTLEQVLDSLDPPVTHELMQCGTQVSLLLMDDSVPAFAQRSLAIHELKCPETFRAAVLSAVNELRMKGSHVPLETLPDWDLAA